MARARIRLNSRGLAAILKGDAMQAAIAAKAEEVAQNVREQGILIGDKDGGKHEKPLPVKVEQDVTDRARAAVILAHPAGLAVQAKHGALSKAAAQAGLDVRSRK